ncbi:hypothetical protein ABW19_dt0200737 [Dactylella cylindrospora]|nr:hypothetical protein ABW19_dt0200737 [Dactylella cylindrospora]
MKPTSATTPVSLLLTNLRLLDLPNHPDLPITEETFSLGRNKSKAFEHIVHHIFNRYDPVECKSRFAGNWPIYEPAQSKNFRAAAIAWLTDLKKTGALHNAVIIRKSMFDDCQGERYEELLLSLSAMALKRVVERENSEEIGSSIAFEEALSSQPDMDTTNILNLAYQHSLKNTLQHRFVEKQKWFLASRRLEERDQLVSDKEQSTALARESRKNLEVKENDITSIWEKNWVGDQSIYKLLLPEKDHSSEQDMWSDASFQRLLQTGSFVSKGAPTADSGAILNEMETSLRVHQKRISRWTEYNEQFLRERAGVKKAATIKKVSFAADVGGGLGVDFNKHQDLHASAFTLQEGTQLPLPSADDEFGKLFNSMRKELQTIRVSRRRLGTLSYANTYGDSEEEEQEPTPPALEPEKPSSAKTMTEEEALMLLTSHLPVDANPPKPQPNPEPKDSLAALRASLQASRASLAEKPLQPEPELEEEDEEEELERPSPKPRLRSPPPPIKRLDPEDEEEEDSEEPVIPQSASPESPPESISPKGTEAPTGLKVAQKQELSGDREEPEEEDSYRYEGESFDDSIDEHMVEKMIAQIATSSDTPAPVRPQRVFPQPAWSREELEEDPFKSRPKVALSPPLTPHRFQIDRDDSGQPTTPRVDHSSGVYEDDDDDDDSMASPSRGRGRSYR